MGLAVAVEMGGLSVGWILGLTLLDGDSEGIEEGTSDDEGASLGSELGSTDILGFSDGCD